MDQKTVEALSKMANEVDAGTKPTGDAVMPVNADHDGLQETLKKVQEEQAINPEKFAPAVQAAPPEEPDNVPKVVKEEMEAFQKAVNEGPTEPVICQKCGWDHNSVSVWPTEKEVREFTRSVLGDRGFEKEYSFLGGEINVTFRERTSSEKDKITEILKTVKPGGESRVSIEVLTDIRRVQTLYAIKSVKGHECDHTLDIEVKAKDCAAALKEFEKQIGSKYSATLVDIIIRGFVEFDRLLAVLTEAAFDENFWEGAGLESPSKPTVAAP